MWNGKVSSVFVASVAAIVMVQPAWAQRSQEYTPERFVSVLNGFGYPVPLDATLSDPRVQQAIRDFQIQNRLPVDGTLNPPTQDQAAALVRQLQLNLNRVSKPSPNLPGSQFYGQQTDAAVRAFQQQQRLPVTGIATLETRQRIADILNDGMPRNPGPTGPNPQQPGTTTGNLYTEAQFRALLLGFGYEINAQRPLSDRSAMLAIRDFQQLYGIGESGQADQKTQAIASSVMRNLRNGLRLVLQINLPITPYYDGDVAAALRQFQTRYGLPANGVATSLVRSRVDAEARRVR
jgi:peptidoglycan hydrolase-like protein with peptidoglycan-binding domain